MTKEFLEMSCKCLKSIGFLYNQTSKKDIRDEQGTDRKITHDM